MVPEVTMQLLIRVYGVIDASKWRSRWLPNWDSACYLFGIDKCHELNAVGVEYLNNNYLSLAQNKQGKWNTMQ